MVGWWGFPALLLHVLLYPAPCSWHEMCKSHPSEACNCLKVASNLHHALFLQSKVEIGNIPSLNLDQMVSKLGLHRTMNLVQPICRLIQSRLVLRIEFARIVQFENNVVELLGHRARNKLAELTCRQWDPKAAAYRLCG